MFFIKVLCFNGRSCFTAIEKEGNVQQNVSKVGLDFGEIKENIKVDNKKGTAASRRSLNSFFTGDKHETNQYKN